ncbi:redoxin domain-containing protein [Frondihabitans peucedani]|uniref:TlpA disulfide reductase family protein n=1 Tax=Frondihabitans peucedani TaxID=598626 RepID=A0ABP8E011_9MICO
MNHRRIPTLARLSVIGVLVAVALTGCASKPAVTQNQNYISGDGTVTEIKPADRGASVEFTAKTDEGRSISRKTYQGDVVVLNFWYASCPPCRVEAPDLAALSTKYDSKGVQFIGVNVRDEADTARAFDRSFKMPYPSVIDATDAKVQLALAGQRGPNATPTTMVLDQKGRVAARVLGQVNKSVLDTLISDTMSEGR